VWSLGFGQCLEFSLGVCGLGFQFRVSGFGLGYVVQGLGCRVLGEGSLGRSMQGVVEWRVKSLGFGV